MTRRGRGRALITLSSDVGAAYAAQMKAVLARSIEPGRVVDLVHDLPRHGVAEAAFVVRAVAAGFPPGTIHVVVVDPGVGGSRASIAIVCRDGSRLVGPDNGVLFPLAEALGGTAATFRIDPGRSTAAPRVGTTFDGRDVFAPAAVRLAGGTAPSRLGPRVHPSEYRVPAPARRPGAAVGQVVHVDRFGNLITNIPTDWAPPTIRRVGLRVGRRTRLVPWTRSYASLRDAGLGALGSSFGTIEIAVREGDAAVRLGARTGTPVVLRWNGVDRRAAKR